MAVKSLRTDLKSFIDNIFPELSNGMFIKIRRYISAKINSKYGIAWVILFVVTVFLISQLPSPSFLRLVNLPFDTSKTIIDQRITNLATIFSVTLVVMGWLLTNITVKESLSYQMLFKKTRLYPTFFFVITLVGSLIVGSLLRHVPKFNLGDFMIAGTFLIIVALVLITSLFVKLIEVVDSKFLYNALETEVLLEVYKKAKPEIIKRRSLKSYNNFCQELGFSAGVGSMTDLSGHTGINIFPYDEPASDDIEGAFFSSKTSKNIKDINFEAIRKAFESVGVSPHSYFKPLHINSTIPGNFNGFYLKGKFEISKKTTGKIRKAFKLTPLPREPKIQTTSYQEHFTNRFLKDVKDGNRENIQRALSIYSKIFDLENKIIQEC